MKKVFAIALALILMLSVIPFSAVNAAQTKRLVFMSVGDSIAHGTGLKDKANDAYGAIVSEVRGYDFINDAVGGYTSDDLLKQFTDKNHPKYCGNDAAKADIICISIGGNDILKDSDISKAFYSGDYLAMYSAFNKKSSSIASNIRSNVKKVIAKIKELNPDAVVLFQNIYNPVFVNDTLRGLAGIGLDVFNKSITDINEKNVFIPDVCSVINSASMMNSDMIHPNEKGHMAIADAVDKCLTKALGNSQQGEPTPSEPDEDSEDSMLDSVIQIIITFVKIIISFISSISALIK